MKKTFILILLCIATMVLFANEWQTPVQQSKDIEFRGYIQTQQVTRVQDPAPNYSFIPNGNGEAVTYLYDSYYDYMPFSYNSYNLRVQPEVSMPYGWSAHGLYLSYHCAETTNVGADRRAWNSYINADGTLLQSSGTNHYGIYREGFTSLAVDPVTGNPFFVWHAIVEADATYDSHITYDNFHISGATGFWKAPWILFDNPEVSIPLTGAEDDEFIWPVTQIGGSPIDGKRRIWAYANNSTNNASGGANYNSIIGYADFNADDLLFESELDWTYITCPDWDDAQYNDIDRVNKDMVVNDAGQVAFIGSYNDSLFCYYSNDFGQNFTMYKQEFKFPVWNPQNQDNSYYFLEDDEVTPSEMYMVLSNDGSHYNGVFSDNNSKVMWMSGVNINKLSAMEAEPASYYPAYFYPKIFSFDIETGTFGFYDMNVQNLDPADDSPAIPWDLNEDGAVDEFYEDGTVYIPLSMNSWFFNTDQGYQDAFFHESNMKMVANNNWVVAAWHDCAKHRYAYFGEDGFDSWLQKPEIAISISDDSGETWSDILYLNSNSTDVTVDEDLHLDGNYAPAFEDMLPVNISLGDKLEVISNVDSYHAKLHFAFFDDNDYGSAAGQTEGGGILNGGKIRYAALDLEFQNPCNAIVTGSDENTIPENIASLSQNFPNPFNPVTKIQYQVKEASDIAIDVYNVKGQKIKTLVNENLPVGNYEVIWNGNDDNNRQVSSGIYFYKLKSGNQSQTKKMVLMK